MPSRGTPAVDKAYPDGIPLRGGRRLDFSEKPLIMGVLNATPDSFYAESRVSGTESGLERALRMIDEGADILDVGGESTRPGSLAVPLEAELARVLPLIEAIRQRSDRPISIDTRKAEVARRAVQAGADIINDVSALRDDPAMVSTASDLDVPVVLMHMQGTPATMQDNPHYDDALAEVAAQLAARAKAVSRRGISSAKIILDPGIGFGKRLEDNVRLIRGIPKLMSLGYPVLIGLSRKGFLGAITGRKQADMRLAATIAANAYALLAGADILRVHDVRETVDMKRVLRAIGAED